MLALPLVATESKHGFLLESMPRRSGAPRQSAIRELRHIIGRAAHPFPSMSCSIGATAFIGAHPKVTFNA
jgi:hypothetical protein